MKYSKQATEDFARLIDKDVCLELIGDLIIKEGYTETIATFTDDEVALNMDCVEVETATLEGRRDLLKSMDVAFVIEDPTGTIQEIVFAEFKLRFTGMRNLRPEDLTEKISGSTIALNHPPNIHGDYYFVFNSRYKEEARRKLFRLAPRVPQPYISVDMGDLKRIFF